MFIAIANAIGRNTGLRTDGLAPVNTIAPVISGTNTVGSILTSTTGTWTSDTGVTGYLYQWTRDGVNISSATSSTYTLVTADLSKTIRCKVAATDLDGTSSYVNSNSFIIYDANYKAILDYATTNNYTLPNDAQKLKQNQLLIDLKAAGIWNKLDTFALFATNGSSQFALIDWKRLINYEAVSNPTFTTNEGFTGNGTASYIDTKFNPTIGTNNYKLNDASRYLYMFMANSTNALDGIETVNTNRMLRSTVSTQTINQGSSTLSSTFNFTNVKGIKSIHRTSSTNVQLFNDTTGESKTATSTSLENKNQFILRSGTTNYGAHEISMYAMGASLVSENTSFVNAINTYMTGL